MGVIDGLLSSKYNLNHLGGFPRLVVEHEIAIEQLPNLEVTTIIRRVHLSINGVRAKSIDYFREKLFDFLVQT